MKASKFQTLRIMLHSGFVFFKYTLLAIYLGFRNQLNREKADVFIKQWAQKIVDIVRVNYRVFNPHQTQIQPHQRYIYMINHSSLYDIPISFLTLPGTIRMIAKKELFRIPLMSRTMKLIETPSIDRQNRSQAIKDLAFARKKMESGIALWIAPEGTRSRDGKLHPLKKGGFIMAIQSQAQIIPVGIRNADKILPPKTWNFHLDQTIEVHIGEPIDASHYSIENKDELVKKVEQQLRQLAGLYL